MTDLNADTAAVTFGEPKRRRRIRIVVWAVAAAVVLTSIVSALWVAGDGTGASPVRSALIGRPAPELAGETVTGGHASLAAYQGRWVIVNFFASWCIPCQQETPELVRFAAAHRGAKDPTILGVVYQDDDASVRSFVHDHGVTWPLLAYRTSNQAAAYGVAGIPVTFLVNPHGRVASKVLGGLRAGQLDILIASAQVTPGSSTTSPVGS